MLLVRHGETVENKARILQGQTNGNLNEVGRHQAAALRDRMRDEKIDAFVSSDLARAVETCEMIAAPHGAKVVQTHLLRERDWGGFTGKFIPDLKDLTWPDDIESMEQMLERAQAFMEWVRQNFPNQKVLAVGHGLMNRALQSAYHQKSMKEIEPMDNGEVRTLML